MARSLAAYAGRDDLLVLGMARGGVAVARVVADALGAPLDVAVARKLGVPGIEEVALDAVAEGVPGTERVALLGASTGAAAALLAAAERPAQIHAVVSRGGRVDLAGEVARQVRAPTLLVVGGADAPTLQWNRDTLSLLPRGTRLTVVPDAGHTFEEPGALGAVGERASAWLEGHVLGRGALRRAVRKAWTPMHV